MEGSLYILEGVCCSGKSTWIKYFQNLKSTKVIKEASEWITTERAFPTTFQEARDNEKFFLEIEAMRYRKARDYMNEGYTVVADRGFISTLCVGYGFKYLFQINTWEELFQDVLTYVETGDFYSPHLYIYLNVSNQTIYQRNQTRTNRLNDSWIGEDVLAYHRFFYEKYGQVMKDRWLALENNGGSQKNSLDKFERCKQAQVSQDDLLNRLFHLKRSLVNEVK